jgi:hypothetical protein
MNASFGAYIQSIIVPRFFTCVPLRFPQER